VQGYARAIEQHERALRDGLDPESSDELGGTILKMLTYTRK